LETDAQGKKGLTRGQGTILVVLVLAIAGVYALVALMLRGRDAGPTIATAPTRPAPVPLSEASAKAREWAAAWQADAQLVGVTSGWQAAGPDGATLYQSEWTFSYYSAAAGLLQIVMVDRQGVRTMQQLPARQAPAPVEADWSFTSDDMLLTFMAHGGQAFLDDHPRASLRLQLSAREGGSPAWYLSAIDPQVGASLQVRIDALSREVIVG
jgi:hypothetical protein